MGAVMLVPAFLDFHHKNPDWLVFLESCLVVCMLSLLMFLATRGQRVRFCARFGFLLTVSLWVTAIIIGALPLYFSHQGIAFSHAIFESTSGVTTTGATVLVGLDHFPKGLLLWRSFLCFLGGIGFVGLALLLLPSLRIGGSKLYQMESSNESEKILPRVSQIANGIVISYVGLSGFCILCYYIGGMSLFDAVNYSMSTIATAGFAPHDQALDYYNSPVLWLVGCWFMLLASLPFNLYVKLVLSGFSGSFRDPQIKFFLVIIIFLSFIIAVALHFSQHLHFAKSFLESFFQLVSAITTTGYSVKGSPHWGGVPLAILFLATFIGGCAGSTTGGIKINRLFVFVKIIMSFFNRLISPHKVIKVRYGSAELSQAVMQSVLFYISLYFISLLFGTLALVMTDMPFDVALMAAQESLSNTGIMLFDRAINFHTNSNALWIQSFLMLAGRLELTALFIIFTPVFWRE